LAAVLAAALVCGGLAAGCKRDKAETGAKQKDVVAPRPPVTEIEGSPWEPVINAQSSLMDLFAPEGDPGKILWNMQRFRKKRLDGFRKDCQAALRFYAEKPEERIEYITKAGQVWVTVEKHVNSVTKGWSPGDLREVKILLNQFQCR